MARPTGKPSRSIPLRLTKPQTARVEHAASRLGISKQDIMRMAMGIGIEALKLVDWNIEKLVADSAFPSRVADKVIPLSADEPTLKAAEEEKKKGYGPPGEE